MFFNICKNLSLTRIQQVGRILSSQTKEVIRSCDVCCYNKVLGGSINGVPLQRYYSIDSKEDPAPENTLPPLAGNLIMVPGIFKTISSTFQLQRHLKRFDPSFEISEFIAASKQAVETVSHLLSKENYEALEELVTPDVIQQLRQKICTLAPAQKDLIAVRKEDIYGQFPYTVQMLYEGEGDNKKAYAEILVVYYSLRGLKELIEKNINPPLQMGLMPEYRDKIFLLNYRFIKDFTNGTDEPWIVNLCNQVMLLAYK
ncbi:uncharacterized protein LOC135159771 [Diachasmimorpha longicaudata]|uniref:uncharacterized protein LOC135159771 n=1 Tax=Diachasmimorpha longicaudata TaxID=58733 RepID=UPI0030B86BC2